MKVSPLMKLSSTRTWERPTVEEISRFAMAGFVALLLTGMVLSVAWVALATLAVIGEGIYKTCSWALLIGRDLTHHHYRLSFNWNHWTPAAWRLLLWGILACF